MSPDPGEGVTARMFAAAEAARTLAHAPYSHFAVGAAVLGDDGAIHAGCNVENAAYPLGTCAEASAIAAMVAAGARAIRAIAVVGGAAGAASGFVTPCGGCRQRIREFARPDTSVLTRDAAGTIRCFSLEDLLPHAFGPDTLERAARKDPAP